MSVAVLASSIYAALPGLMGSIKKTEYNGASVVLFTPTK